MHACQYAHVYSYVHYLFWCTYFEWIGTNNLIVPVDLLLMGTVKSTTALLTHEHHCTTAHPAPRTPPPPSHDQHTSLCSYVILNFLSTWN